MGRMTQQHGKSPHELERFRQAEHAHMNHLERSEETAPLASIQAYPALVPATTQERER